MLQIQKNRWNAKCNNYKYLDVINNTKENIMLILTRRIGETLIIKDDITITVLSIKGHQVRLGINAPPEISVHRKEIWQKIQTEKSRNDG